ncbi:MAG: hypothetical protein B7Y51_05035 [Burkholderiales bacterium 28-67-8]|nr:MAG: hypothetical protein B7Y51_05035 [Burkholderiales bacterium 28-67-8]
MAGLSVSCRRLCLASVALSVWALLGCSALPGPPPEAADAVFAGVVDASGARPDPAALLQRLRGARYVLLGEIHDNAQQHELRAALLRRLLSDGVPSVVVFEQIDREHSAALGAAAIATPNDVEAVIAAGALDRAGWRWPLHRPVFAAALDGGAALAGGNLSRADASRLVRGGTSQAPADLRELIDPDQDASWTREHQAELLHQVDIGHCGALPASMLAPMALAQRGRDAALAMAMVQAARQAAPGARVVLIAGNGHVRRDIGVPHDLARLEAGAREVSVAFLESDGGRPGTVDGPYDTAWFTPSAERTDPCADFKPPAAAAR